MKVDSVVLYPKYYEDFSCIGSACENNCCMESWNIEIEKKIYLEYRNVRDPKLKEMFEGNIKRVKEKPVRDLRYATIVMKDNKCPFLDENRLCQIHGQLGEEHLGHVCKSYPRQYNTLQTGILEYSLAMSCPEAIRKALFNPEPMAFVQSSFKDMPKKLRGNPNFTRPEEIVQKTVGGSAWDIRNACIDIMQARKYSIRERIFLIGMMLNALTEVTNQNDYSGISPLLQKYRVIAQSDAFAGTLDSFAKNDGVRLQIEPELLKILSILNRPIFERMMHTLAEEYVLTEDAEATKHALLDRIKKWEPTHWSTWLEANSHILENYFVSYIFGGLFPFKYLSNSFNLYHHFVILAEQYAVIRMLFCAAPEEQSHYPEDFVTQTLRAVAYSHQHSTTPVILHETYKALQLESLAHMSFLLQS